MTQWIFLFFGAAFLENATLLHGHGSTHALSGARSLRSSLAIGLLTTAIMALSGPLSYLVCRFLLIPLGLAKAKLLFLSLIPAFFATVFEILMKKKFPKTAESLGIYLPLTAVNCAILSLCLTLSNETGEASASLFHAFFYSLGTGAGFLLASLLLCLVQSRIQEKSVPSPFRGVPMSLISAGLCALCFSGVTALF